VRGASLVLQQEATQRAQAVVLVVLVDHGLVAGQHLPVLHGDALRAEEELGRAQRQHVFRVAQQMAQHRLDHEVDEERRDGDAPAAHELQVPGLQRAGLSQRVAPVQEVGVVLACVGIADARERRGVDGMQRVVVQGPVQAALGRTGFGPWSDGPLRALGYRFPLFIKRGYHQHYQGGASLGQPVLDAERGYVLAPMPQGLRLTTGAEFAPLQAPPTPVQLARAEPMARELLALGQPVAAPPWLGARPCTADMLPVMGPAPRHPGLWFNFGHAHQGFTLGAVAGRLLAQMVGGEPTGIDMAPYAATRF